MTARSLRRADAVERGERSLAARLLRVLGILLMASAVALSLSRAPDRPVETLVARWALPPSAFQELDGQLVHLRDVGPRDDPLPVVLLHGMSSSLHTWEGWVRGLERQRRVITLDLPGFGLTGPRADADYRPQTDARFVLALLDRLGVGRFVVGGNSLGGEIAWRIATQAPERIERLILVDSAGIRVESRALPIGWQLARVPGLNHIGEWMLPRALVADGVSKAYGGPEQATSERVDRHFELTLREGNRRALAQRLASYEPGADAAQLAGIAVPTLILWGGQDQLIPPSVGREFQSRIAGSELVLFDDLAHLPHEQDPARTLVPVKAFLGLQ